MSVESFIKEVESMSVVQLHELVEALKEKFGVSGMAAMSTAVAGGADVQVAEKTSFDVVIKETGANKIALIKEVKAITGLGLKESKDIVDTPDVVVKKGVDKTTAEEIKSKLESAGAKVELR